MADEKVVDRVRRGVEDPSMIYLDYNATSPIRPEAVDAVLAAMGSVGNPSSRHGAGQVAARLVETARRQLATVLHCDAGEIIFTSGATEANNLALRTTFVTGQRLVTSAVEHPAVLETARDLTAGAPGLLVVLPVSRDGMVDLDALDDALHRGGGGGGVVSLMAANNETGVLTDLAPVVDRAHAVGMLVHTDATQMVGRMPIDLDRLDVDLLSLSAHKFGGPQGVGAMFLRRGTALPHRPLLTGGGQERGWRAGTLNVAGIAGAGAAAEAADRTLAAEAFRVRWLREGLEAAVTANVARSWVNGASAPRLPGVSSVTVDGVPADAIMAGMPNVAVSDGSACASGAPTPSHVLTAMGLTREQADNTVRFSLGYGTSESDIVDAVAAFTAAVSRIRDTLTYSAIR